MQTDASNRRTQAIMTGEPAFYHTRAFYAYEGGTKLLMEIERYLQKKMQKFLPPSIVRNVQRLEDLVRIYLEQQEVSVPESTTLYVVTAFYVSLRNNELLYRDILHFLNYHYPHYTQITGSFLPFTGELVVFIKYVLAKLSSRNVRTQDMTQYMEELRIAIKDIELVVSARINRYQSLLTLIETNLNVKEFENEVEECDEDYDAKDPVNNSGYVDTRFLLPRLTQGISPMSASHFIPSPLPPQNGQHVPAYFSSVPQHSFSDSSVPHPGAQLVLPFSFLPSNPIDMTQHSGSNSSDHTSPQ